MNYEKTFCRKFCTFVNIAALWNINYELQGYKNVKQTRDSEYLHGEQ